MSKTLIQFFGGLKTIGGTIIQLQYGQSRVIFDFGLTFDPGTAIFDGQVKVRNSAIVRDYFKLGMIPKIEGIYKKEHLPSDSVISAEEYEGETAVLISHLHLDHMGAIGCIDPSIPVYMTEQSRNLYNQLQLIGEGVPGERSYQSCEYDQSFHIGEIKITPLSVDHDVIGACAFHLETPDAKIIYTGDFRLHGSSPEMMEEFLQKAKELRYDAVIIEGTMLKSEEELAEHLLVSNNELPDELLTETKLQINVAQMLKEIEGVGVFNIYHRNMERINGMCKAGEETKRKVVLEIKTAQLAHTFLPQCHFYIFESEELKTMIRENKLLGWQKQLLEKYPLINIEKINENPNRYFVQNSYENIMELFDLHVENGVYIHSNGVPLGDYDPAFHNLEKILALLSLERAEVSSGGHALPQHLKYIVDELDPKVLIPLHSFYPERLKPKNGQQLLPVYGEVYEIGDIVNK